MSEIISLSNNNVEVKISTLGAELISAKVDGVEKLWQGGGDFWRGTAPILFPFCGNTFGGYYNFKGKDYQINSHGFARKTEFKVVSKQKTQVTFLIESTPETKAVYPFDFKFRVMCKLNGYSIGVYYIVENFTSEDMYFNVGSHESYRLEGDLGDYYIRFENNETQLTNSLLKDNFITGKTEQIALTKYGLKIEDFFTLENDGNSVIVENVKSKRVTLNKNGEDLLSVYYNDFPHMVIWTQHGAPFIAIEPWNGLPDKYESNHLLTEKYSVDKIGANETKTFYHSITFID